MNKDQIQGHVGHGAFGPMKWPGRPFDRGTARLAPRAVIDYAQIRKMVEDRELHVLDFSILPKELPGFWHRDNNAK